jgi:nucleoside-diphosphate-sugar epimerase
MGVVAMNRRLALVTGSSGFLGRFVVRDLVARGFRVRALSRGVAGSETSGVEHVLADLCTSELDSCLAGVDVVVHLAACMEGPYEQMHRANVHATRRLLDAMRRSTCRHLVHASSLSVYRWDVEGSVIDERSELLRGDSLLSVDAYSSTKAQQELLVREIATQEGWAVTVLRPAALWDTEHYPDYVVGPRRGAVQVVIGPRGIPRVAFIGNAASWFGVAAARTSGPREVLLNVVDENSPSRARFAAVVGKTRARLTVPVPYALIRTVVRFVAALFKQQSLPFFLQSHIFECLYSSTEVRNAVNVEQFGLLPLRTFEDAHGRGLAS